MMVTVRRLTKANPAWDVVPCYVMLVMLDIKPHLGLICINSIRIPYHTKILDKKLHTAQGNRSSTFHQGSVQGISPGYCLGYSVGIQWKIAG